MEKLLEILKRIGSFFLMLLILPLVDAAERADRRWRTKMLRQMWDALPPESQLKALLREMPVRIPPELSLPAPRPDVWSSLGCSCTSALVHGLVHPGKVLGLASRQDSDGIDAAALYGWIDAAGELQLREASASFDPMHIEDRGHFSVSRLLASVWDGMHITVVEDPRTGDVVVYEVLDIVVQASSAG